MKKPLALLAVLLLAGCTGIDDARQAAEDAQEAVTQAQREAQEARDRYERVASATIVREERLRVIVVPMSNATEVWFDVGGWRGNESVPPENLSAAPLVRVQGERVDVACDPLTCRLARSGADLRVTWDDGAAGEVALRGGHASCAEAGASSDYCALGQLEREATVRVRATLGSVTS